MTSVDTISTNATMIKLVVVMICEFLIVFSLVHIYKTRGMLVYGYSFKPNIKLKAGVNPKQFMKSCRINEYLSILCYAIIIASTFYGNIIFTFVFVAIAALIVWQNKKLTLQIDKQLKKK